MFYFIGQWIGVVFSGGLVQCVLDLALSEEAQGHHHGDGSGEAGKNEGQKGRKLLNSFFECSGVYSRFSFHIYWYL